MKKTEFTRVKNSEILSFYLRTFVEKVKTSDQQQKLDKLLRKDIMRKNQTEFIPVMHKMLQTSFEVSTVLTDPDASVKRLSESIPLILVMVWAAF